MSLSTLNNNNNENETLQRRNELYRILNNTTPFPHEIIRIIVTNVMIGEILGAWYIGMSDTITEYLEISWDIYWDPAAASFYGELSWIWSAAGETYRLLEDEDIEDANVREHISGEVSTIQEVVHSIEFHMAQ